MGFHLGVPDWGLPLRESVRVCSLESVIYRGSHFGVHASGPIKGVPCIGSSERDHLEGDPCIGSLEVVP